MRTIMSYNRVALNEADGLQVSRMIRTTNYPVLPQVLDASLGQSLDIPGTCNVRSNPFVLRPVFPVYLLAE